LKAHKTDEATLRRASAAHDELLLQKDSNIDGGSQGKAYYSRHFSDINGV
jgi:hypothetical protein